jgi:hypothetical protein
MEKNNFDDYLIVYRKITPGLSLTQLYIDLR